MDNIESIFSTPIYKRNLQNMHGLDNEFINFLKEEKNKKRGRKKSNVNGFQSDLFSAGVPLVDKFHQTIAPAVMDFLKSYNLPENIKFKLSPIWINSNKKDSYNLEHTHDGEFSIVYYIKVPKNSGGIVFKNPNPAFTILHFYELQFKKFNNFNSQKFTVIPKNNDIVMFPSHLVHSVETNLSKQERISVACNVYIDG